MTDPAMHPLDGAALRRRTQAAVVACADRSAAPAATDVWLQGWAPDLGETAAGIKLSEPDPLTLAPRALGVQLGRLPRFAGATCAPWSVADHQRLTGRIARRVVARDVTCDRRLWRIVVEALIHDVPEVLTGDIPYPALLYLDHLVPGIGHVLDAHLHQPMLRAMRIACGLSPNLPEADARMVKHADLAALAVEREHLMAVAPPGCTWRLPPAPALKDLGLRGALRASPTAEDAGAAWHRDLEEALTMLGVRPLWHLPPDLAANAATRLRVGAPE